MEKEYKRPILEIVEIADDVILTSQQFAEPDENEIGQDWLFRLRSHKRARMMMRTLFVYLSA